MSWLQGRGSYTLAHDVLEVAQIALQVNVLKEKGRLSRAAVQELEALIG
jgi:hypothetical protein